MADSLLVLLQEFSQTHVAFLHPADKLFELIKCLLEREFRFLLGCHEVKMTPSDMISTHSWL